MLLPLIGAGLGGYTAYQKSGGNLGATLLGAGTGALVPGGLRMAGTALAGTPVGAAGLGALNKLLGKAGVEATAKGIGNLAALGGTTLLGAPSLAGNVAAGLVPAASRGAGGAANLAVSASQPGQATYDAGGAVPQTPYRTTPYDSLAVADPSGAIGAARLNELLMQDIELAGIRKLMPELFKAAEARSKPEFQRQMAAAGIRQNIATAANMLERSQQAAQQMGLNAAQQMGSALTSQYQYQ
jgi:hypothetical protein